MKIQGKMKYQGSESPLFHLFDFENNPPPSIEKLDPLMTINGISVSPMLEYNAKDALNSVWNSWRGFGPNLSGVDAPITNFDAGLPFFGKSDKAIITSIHNVSGTGYWTAGDTSTGTITTEDVVVRIIYRTVDTNVNLHPLISKRKMATNFQGWQIGAGLQCNFSITNGSPGWEFWGSCTASLDPYCWVDVMHFYDVDGSTAAYANGLLSGGEGAGGKGSAALDSGEALRVCSDSAGYFFDGAIAYFAIWKKDNWLNNIIEYSSLAQELHYKLTGIWPQQARGIKYSYYHIRDSYGYMEKIEEDGSIKTHKTSSNFARICEALDCNGKKIIGYLSESQSTNLLLQSETLGTTWTQVALSSISSNDAYGPTGYKILDGLVGNASDTQHGITQDITLAANTYCLSCWVTPGDKSWCYLFNSTISDGYAYFDLSANGNIGDVGSDVLSYGIKKYNSSLYRIWITFTGTAASHTVGLYAANADGDNDFAGDTATANIHAGCFQCEVGKQPSSYINTTLATKTRKVDCLGFYADENTNTEEGLISCKVLLPDQHADGYLITLADNVGMSSNSIAVYVPVGSESICAKAKSGTVLYTINTDTNILNNKIHQIEHAWKTNMADVKIDKIYDGTSAHSCSVPTKLDTIQIGSHWQYGYQNNGIISDINVYGSYNESKNSLPIFKAFEFNSNNLPSVDRINPILTINGQSVEPMFVYNAKDATSANWPAWNYGETLTRINTYDNIIFNNGSPLHGPNDDSVMFVHTTGDAQGFEAANNTICDVTTEDVIIRVIFKPTATYQFPVMGKYNYDYPTNNKGYMLYLGPWTYIQFVPVPGGPAYGCSPYELTGEQLNSWHDVMFFVDRSGTSRAYLDGIQNGNIGTATTSSVSNSEKFNLGCLTGVNGYNGSLAYIAMWKADNWLDSSAQDSLVAKLFAELTGTYPQKYRGTPSPTFSRSSFGYSEKYSSGTRKIYRVGNNWPRINSKIDANNNVVVGYLSEGSATNLLLQSQTLGTTWTPVALTSISADDAYGPDGPVSSDGSVIVRALDGLVASASDTQHGITQDITLAANTYCLSCWAKSGDKTWCYLFNSTISNGYAYFQLSGSGSLGTIGAGVLDCGIEKYTIDLYRIWITFTGTVASHTVGLYAANADGDNDFAGDASTVNLDAGCFQCEVGGYPSSYIPTTTDVVTRSPDILRYVADDGNLHASQGSLSADVLFSNGNNILDGYLFSLNDGGSKDNSISTYVDHDAIHSKGMAAGGSQYQTSGSKDVVNGLIHSIKHTWRTNLATTIVDGTTEGSEDTSCTIPTGLDRITIGSDAESNNQLNGIIAKIKIYGK